MVSRYSYEFPDSLESYYQEPGRAGRDGLSPRAELLYRLEDRRIQKFFLVGRHQSFGRGTVLDTDGENLMVRFERAGVKEVRTTFVRAAS